MDVFCDDTFSPLTSFIIFLDEAVDAKFKQEILLNERGPADWQALGLGLNFKSRNSCLLGYADILHADVFYLVWHEVAEAGRPPVLPGRRATD
jgi:hypothetical protein